MFTVLYPYPMGRFFHEGIEYRSCTLIGKLQEQEENLYRLIIRVSDGAFQVLMADEEPKQPMMLFLDSACTKPACIIASKYGWLEAGQKGTDHRLSRIQRSSSIS
jgi:hypothetical protein